MSKYALLDLGSGFLPRAINVKGHVCGGQWSIPTLATVSATVYSEGVKTDLGALLGATASMAADINASGDVAGEWYDEIGSHAFLYAGGEAHKLPDKVGAAPLEHNMTVAINDVGDVVGYGAHVDTHDPVPWLRKPSGEVVNLRKVKGHLVDWIYDINNN